MDNIASRPGQAQARQPGDAVGQRNQGGQFWQDLACSEGWGLGRCLGCHSCLRKSAANRCPRCGRNFDPANPQTMNMAGGPSPWLRLLVLLRLRRAWD